MIKPFKIIIAGEGGQGVQVIGKALAVAGFIDGKKTTYIPNYGVEQRGGVSLAFVQVSQEAIPFPKFSKADILVVLCQRAVKRTERYITKDTLYIYETGQIDKKELNHLKCKKIGLGAQDFSKQYLSQKVSNMIYLASIVQALGYINWASVFKAVEKELGAKIMNDPVLHKLNFKALEAGKKMIKKELGKESCLNV
jgi:2-oxoglutarate ferredoxin oxidoreductase subunit gamma